ncbi:MULTISPECIES: GAF domain-containing sensor histidine kinase [Nostocales]|uniref:histidine kinase n=3 Tax=Nostocales TaxID=1161 RepID=A0A0C1R1A0_9CYAN|nr:GAF domain-containing protein [Tolypothrix bouteillei]KAF3887462.1 GAF domain-containing protein [Tolypothrix bouteillei VB521301]
MSPRAKHDLQLRLEQENLLRRIVNNIRRTLSLEEILTTTVAEVRSLLGIDRVLIYKFHPDNSGQVIAEAIHKYCLPSLLGLNFPADDIPLHARENFIKARVRSVAHVASRQIGHSPLRNLESVETDSENIQYRPIDPCHLEYLTAMGVTSSLITPIFHQEQLWGLLVSHDSGSRVFDEDDVEAVQRVVDQLAVAIAQSNILTQAHQKSQREAIVNRVATLLHSMPVVELQPALEAAVTAFGGSGGRLCIRNQAFDAKNNTVRSLAECLEAGEQFIKIYTIGQQPLVPEIARYQLMEQYSVWQEHYDGSGDCDIWAIPDIYKTPKLRNLQVAFRPTKIRSILMLPLQYRQQLLGYLSIFRDEVDTETLWAGRFDRDERQLYPRLSFEVWREYRKAQPREWTPEELELAQALGKQFTLAIQQREIYQQVNTLNANLENQVKERTAKLQNALHELQQAQTQLIQTEKMSSLGQLVAGVAHEINNPVNFIYGNITHISEYTEDLLTMLELYQRHYPNPHLEIIEQAEALEFDFIIEDLPKILSSIRIGTDRIRQIVLSLRNFSRLDHAEMKLVDIHEGIDSTLLILHYRLKPRPDSPGIDIIKEYGDLPLVECYAGQLNQVFMNVISNAIDALDQYAASVTEAPKGSIAIATSVGQIDGCIPSVVIRISDNGPGMSQDLLQRVFDPFFTTKPIGKGTGLGLSISYQIIVDKHSGIFKCNSQVGSGTEFWIEIPMKQKISST